jgi:hypothetical protein
VLAGTWQGRGRGQYPTVAPFDYEEEATFSPTGKATLAYQQRTWSPADGRPLHSEAGYWRLAGPGRVELVVAHPTGLVEVAEGSFNGRLMQLRSLLVGRTPTAKQVSGTQRQLWVEGDVLGYRLSMAAVGVGLRPHLEAELRRLG